MLYDKKLFFTLKDHECDGKHFIIGNPHTFNGRILGYCTKENSYFNFSLSEIKTMPLETEYWIRGYLHGNEPSSPVDNEDDFYPPEHESHVHWVKSINLFHKTGHWYAGERECGKCGKKLLNSWIGFDCENCNDKV